MRSSNEQSLGDVIKQLLETYNLKSGLNEHNLIAAWDKVMGKTISSRTDQIFIKDSKLYVRFNSAVLKNEISYNREKVIDLLNKEVGDTVITELVLL